RLLTGIRPPTAFRETSRPGRGLEMRCRGSKLANLVREFLGKSRAAELSDCLSETTSRFGCAESGSKLNLNLIREANQIQAFRTQPRFARFDSYCRASASRRSESASIASLG